MASMHNKKPKHTTKQPRQHTVIKEAEHTIQQPQHTISSKAGEGLACE